MSFSTKVVIHDHFDGCANCVECGGPCRLTGEQRLLTELIRWIFEKWARDQFFLDEMTKSTLVKFCVDIGAVQRRAEATK